MTTSNLMASFTGRADDSLRQGQVFEVRPGGSPTTSTELQTFLVCIIDDTEDPTPTPLVPNPDYVPPEDRVADEPARPQQIPDPSYVPFSRMVTEPRVSGQAKGDPRWVLDVDAIFAREGVLQTQINQLRNKTAARAAEYELLSARLKAARILAVDKEAFRTSARRLRRARNGHRAAIARNMLEGSQDIIDSARKLDRLEGEIAVLQLNAYVITAADIIDRQVTP